MSIQSELHAAKLEADLDIARREIDRLKAENAELLAALEAWGKWIGTMSFECQSAAMPLFALTQSAIKRAKGE